MQWAYHQGDLSFSNKGWNVRGLAFCVLASVVMYVSFLQAPFHSLWEEIDDLTFYALNGSVAGGGLWAHILSFANSKLYDGLSGVLLVLILAAFILAGWGKTLKKRLAAVLFMGVYITIVTFVRRKTGIMEYGRPSPSTADLLPFLDLSGMYPAYKPKVSSANSFPSDHGVFCILFVTFFWFYAGWRWGVGVLLLMPLFLMPRLISGAHWLSDTAVGAVVFTLPVIAAAFYTPFAALCCRNLERWINAVAQRVPFIKSEGMKQG